MTVEEGALIAQRVTKRLEAATTQSALSIILLQNMGSAMNHSEYGEAGKC